MLTTRNAFSKTGPDPTSSANVATEKETPVISSLTASSSPKSGLNWTPTQTVLPSSKSPAQPKWLSPNSAFCSQPMPRTSPRNPLGCLVSQKSIPWRTATSGMTVRLTASLRPCGQPPSALLFIRTDHARCCYSTVVSTTLMCLPLRQLRLLQRQHTTHCPMSAFSPAHTPKLQHKAVAMMALIRRLSAAF